MAFLKETVYREHKVVVSSQITNVFHGVPTWMFPEDIGGRVQNPCPICYMEMQLQTGHGTFIEACSVIQLDGYRVKPIHTECYEKLIKEQ